MITKKQKNIVALYGFICVFLGILALIPMAILLEKVGIKTNDVTTLELILKFIVYPIIALVISIYFMNLRKKEFYEQIDLSTSIIKMSYIPLAIYTSGLLGWSGGVLYASIPFNESIYSLMGIIMMWSLSAFTIIFLGIFTKWSYNLENKKVLIVNIIFIVLSIILIVLLFVSYKKIGEVKIPTDVNTFVQAVVYVCAYFIILLFLWKSIYGEETVMITLSEDEELSDVEKKEIAMYEVEQNIQLQLLEYSVSKQNKNEVIEEKQNNEKEESTNEEEQNS